mgnify:FL=1
MLYFPEIFFWLFLIKSIKSQSISVGWQSTIEFSDIGMEYSPINKEILILNEIITDSLIICAQHCHSASSCHIFVYDSQSKYCRTYNGDANYTGLIVPSLSSESIVGFIELFPEQFTYRGSPCSFCQGSRYLQCVDSTCQCPPNTFYDGSICRSQRFLDGECFDDSHCRDDFHLTCSPMQTCTRKHSSILPMENSIKYIF